MPFDARPPTRRAIPLAVLTATLAGLLVPTVGTAPASAADATLTPVGSPLVRLDYGSRYYPRATSEAFSSAAVGDVTGDGRPDLVVGGMDGIVRVFSTAGQLLASADSGNGSIQSSPALADIDRDGVLDVTIGNTVGVVASYSFRGNAPRAVFWRLDRGANGQNLTGVFGTPAVADLNGDGRLDIVVSSWDHYVYAYDTNGINGSVLPGWPRPIYDTSWSSPAVGDVDGDGRNDVVVGGDCDGVQGQPCVGSPGGYVWAFRADGSEIWRHKVDGQVVWSSPALYDLDGGGGLEVVVGTGTNFPSPAGSFLLALDGRSGARRWTAPMPGRAMGSPAMGDIDGDGRPEAVVLTEGGTLSAVRADGSILWRSCVDDVPRCPAGAETHGSAVLADVDNDGSVEAVVMAEHWMRVVDGRTGRHEAFAQAPADPGRVYAPASAPTIAAVDGRTMIFQTAVMEGTGPGRGPGDQLAVLAWTTGTAPGAMPWPTFKGSMDRRGVRTGPVLDPAETRRHVRALYLDFLDREPDAAGWDFWTDLLTSGSMSRQQVAYSLATTDEWLGTVITGYYRDTLGRAPDDEGLAFWRRQVRAGMPIAEVAARFYASQEYYQRRGGLGPWVDDLYRVLLGREPDVDGRAHWVAIAQAQGRERVTIGFYASQETLVRRVQSLYATLLGRGADPAGLLTWPPVVRDRGDLQLAATLASSPEYVQRAQRR